MRVLVVTSEPGWVDAVRSMLTAADGAIPVETRQIVQNPALAAAVDALFVAEATISPWTVDTLKQVSAMTDTPLFVLADSVHSQWDDAALFAGAEQIFRRPLRGSIIQLAISRSQRRRAPGPAAPPAPSAVPVAEAADHTTVLTWWRDFSRLLTHARERDRLITEYMGKLREVLCCGRLFLYAADPGGAERTFTCVYAGGADQREFSEFRLSARSGIAQVLVERGIVATRQRLRPDAGRDAAALREMLVFGAEVAVPIQGPAGLAGLVLLGPRISGGDYTEHELTLLYHAVESLAPAFAPPAETPREQPLFPAVLQVLPVGCALLNSSLRVLDANDAFRQQLGRDTANPMGIEHLPNDWAEAIKAAVQRRGELSHFELDHDLSGAPRRIRLNLQPLAPAGGGEALWLMVTEDITDETRLRQELHERSIHNVLQRAGEQLSNEFRNALTPIEILVQIASETSSPRDIERLRPPVSSAIHRLRRRVDNLGYLTKTSIVPELTTVSAVFRSARDRLDNWLEPRHLKTLIWTGEFSKVAFTGDSAAVGLAIAELVMNAVEAADGRPVTITAEDLPEAVNFRVRNPGEWAPASEATGFGHRPFVTSKSTGVGLGVEVATRVAEHHGGRLILGPISSEAVEAVLRLPRNIPAPPKIETRVEQQL